MMNYKWEKGDRGPREPLIMIYMRACGLQGPDKSNQNYMRTYFAVYGAANPFDAQKFSKRSVRELIQETRDLTADGSPATAIIESTQDPSGTLLSELRRDKRQYTQVIEFTSNYSKESFLREATVLAERQISQYESDWDPIFPEDLPPLEDIHIGNIEEVIESLQIMFVDPFLCFVDEIDKANIVGLQRDCYNFSTLFQYLPLTQNLLEIMAHPFKPNIAEQFDAAFDILRCVQQEEYGFAKTLLEQIRS